MPSKKVARTMTKRYKKATLINVKRALKNKNRTVRASKYRSVYGQAGGGSIRSNMGLI